MIRALVILLTAAACHAGSIPWTALLEEIPSLQLTSQTGVTGSPCSAWTAVRTGLTVSQATSTNQPTVTAAAFGSLSGLTFDGISKALSYTGAAVTNTRQGSLQVVFKTPATVTGPVVILSQADSATNNVWWEFGITSTGKLYVESNASGTKLTEEGATVLSASTTYTALLTYDGVDFYLSLNGTEENPLVLTNSGAWRWLGAIGGTPAFTVGATTLSTGNTRFFNGTLGGIWFWNVDITR